MFYKVITQSKSSGIGNGLTYESDLPLQIGDLVLVPLRKAKVPAIVIALNQPAPDYTTKPVTECICAQVLQPTQVQIAMYIAEYYCCTLRHSLGLFLPGTNWLKLVPQSEQMVSLLDPLAIVKGAKQQIVVDFLLAQSPVLLGDLKSETGASPATIKSLQEKSILQITCEVRTPVAASIAPHALPPLAEAQQIALDTIESSTKPTLLFGVTGSGKTEVYCHHIESSLRLGKQAMVLVPEIFLTEHLVHRYRAYFPDANVVLIHSKLTELDRINLWHRCNRNEVQIVIGSRSALFAPLYNLGTIIIDEEHEWTYKQDTVPRYHARTVAEYMAALYQASLVVGSATPSLETWHKVQTKAYTRANLPDRFNQQSLPEVKIIDLVTATFDDYYPFSKTLLAAIQDRLEKREQVILFLNRRGLASALLCFDCRRKVISPATQLPFTVHDFGGRQMLIDHTANITVPAPARCPHCDSENLKTIGAGTQRIEQVLHQLFPNTVTVRADKDTLQSRSSIEDILQKMQSGEASILLGTQAVVKGLDLPNVTLAGVLVADVGLSLPHFRAGERIFQLLTQLVGRSGRHKPGEVLIQTFRPDALEITSASTHNTERFLEAEYKMRHHTAYPPFVPMIRYIARGALAKEQIQALSKQAKQCIEQQSLDCTWLSGPTFFGAGKVWHALCKGKDARALVVKLNLEHIMVDIDPYETI